MSIAWFNQRAVARLVLVSAGCILLLSGCASYRVCGFTQNGALLSSDRSSRRFKIADLRVFRAPSSTDSRFPFSVAARTSREQLIAQIQAARPDIFTDDENAEKINVNFSLNSSRVEGKASILLYIVSLCTLPVWEDCISEGEVKVSWADNSDSAALVATIPLKFETCSKFTCYSPVGAIPYPDRVDASAMRKKSFAMSPDVTHANAVFTKTAADAIARAVCQLGERPVAPAPARRTPPKVVQKTTTATPAPPKPDPKPELAPEPKNVEAVREEPPKCPFCGAIMDEKGKCPLCD